MIQETYLEILKSHISYFFIFLLVYYDVPAIINLVDIVNIGAYDFQTPERNPKEADYATPLYAPQNRNPLLNADAVVSYWLVPLRTIFN